MGLEKRKNGGLYYYRTRRRGKRVQKHYVGAGAFALIFAEQDKLNRTLRDLEREEERTEMDHVETLLASVVEACEIADVLLEAALVAIGHHYHRGEWRRARARRV